MSKVDMHTTVVRAFLRLRPNGVSLGMGELLAAIKLLNQEIVDPQKPDEVVHILQLLWCKNDTDAWQLKRVWQDVREGTKADGPPLLSDTQVPDVTGQPDVDTHHIEQSDAAQTVRSTDVPPPEVGILPFKPPIALSADMPVVELQTYWPVSRRFMSYTWRYLRRPIYAGASDVLDVDATVDAAAKGGFFVEPLYERRVVNSARLLLLLDHRGSMMPFHRYLRDMVETLSESEILAENRAVYYFENVPDAALFQTPYLTKPIDRTRVLGFIDHTTAVLIVSDAGAARRHSRNRQRVRGTFDFLFDIYDHTRFVAWLNPMPYERWADTSAEAVASSVPMFPMNEHGFSGAIDILSGRTALSPAAI